MEKVELNPRLDHRFNRHLKLVGRYLPKKNEYGYFTLHSLTFPEIEISIERLKETFLNPERIYTESLTYAQKPDAHPKGYTRRYEVRRVSEEHTSQMTTCYFDGHIVTDGYLDVFLEENDGFNPNWFTHKVQRHLQLTKEVFEGFVDTVIFSVMFENIENFKWEIYRSGRIVEKKPYAGYHEDIVSKVNLLEIHGRDKWNIKMKITEDVITNIARIFGMDGIPQLYWNDKEELDYPHGMPGR